MVKIAHNTQTETAGAEEESMEAEGEPDSEVNSATQD
jgi:hypothetical protein